MADEHEIVLDRRLEEEFAPRRERIEPLVLRLELEGAEPVKLPAAPHFVAIDALRDERVQTGGADEPVRMGTNGPGDQVVLATVVLHHRKRDQQRPVDSRGVHGAE